MAMAVGSTRTESVVHMEFHRECVIEVTKDRKTRQFVFMELVKEKVYEVCKRTGNLRVYQTFTKAKSRGAYRMVRIYGMDALDITDPYMHKVSVQLQVSIVDSPSKKEKETELTVLRERL